MDRYVDMTKRLAEGRHESRTGEPFYVEHHKHKGRNIVVIYDDIVKEGMAAGLPVISKAYEYRESDHGLDQVGHDLFVDKKWQGRFPTENAARDKLEQITSGSHPPVMLAVVDE
jgi:hypothetical protein